ncbi:MAG: Dabb family protein [Acidimicrobiaceae bacterium]|nr:Dabb family protein [Acidimicrobiaceae bacterium]
MIRHLVAFRFRDDVTDADRQALLDELASFPGQFPAMQRWALGVNISRRDHTYTHAFTVEFAREEDLVAYLDSERHENFVRQRFRPLIEDRAIVSFEAP